MTQKIEIHAKQENLDNLEILHSISPLFIGYNEQKKNGHRSAIKIEAFYKKLEPSFVDKLEKIPGIDSIHIFPCNLDDPFKTSCKQPSVTTNSIKPVKTKNQRNKHNARVMVKKHPSGNLNLALSTSNSEHAIYKTFGVLAINGIYPLNGRIHPKGEDISIVFMIPPTDITTLKRFKGQLLLELNSPAKNGDVISVLTNRTDLSGARIFLDDGAAVPAIRFKANRIGPLSRFALMELFEEFTLNVSMAWLDGNGKICNDIYYINKKDGATINQNLINRIINHITG